jgi:hypothetical protein
MSDQTRTLLEELEVRLQAFADRAAEHPGQESVTSTNIGSAPPLGIQAPNEES